MMEQPWWKRRWVIVTAVVVVVLIAIGAAGGGGKSKKDAATTTTGPKVTTTTVLKISEERKLEAFDACKTFVKRQLKAPSTAKFRDFFGDQAPLVTSTDNKTFDVSSSVDAENSFGAELRQNFDCEIVDQGDAWHLNFVNITDG